MAKSFSVEALVNVAVLDERSGTDMYRKMASETSSAFLKEAFEDLAEQERKHEKRFQELQNALEAGGKPEAVQYPDEYVAYLDVLVSDAGGSRPGKGELAGLDDAALIDLAMKFEQEHLNLQRDMGAVLGEQHSRIIDQVIREEMGHLVTLSALKKQLSG